MFRVKVNTRGVTRATSIMVRNLDTLKPALSEFGAYLRAKSKQKFEQQGPGWPGLAQSTIEHRQHTRTNRITAAGKVRVSSVKAIRRTLRKQVKQGKADASVLQEFDRLIGDMDTRNPLFNVVKARYEQEQNKTIERLKQDLARYEKRKAKGKERSGKRQSDKGKKLLGRLPSTLAAKVTNQKVTVYSRANQIGKVHNEGGTAGHNARIPKREFLALDDGDLSVLQEILVKHLTNGL